MPAPAPIAVRAPGPVLLFDGECGLCNRVVRLLLRWDRRGRLRFSPLQGPAAQSYLRAHGLPTEDFDSLVFVPDWSQWASAPGPSSPSQPLAPGRFFLFKTDGVIAALRVLGADSLAARILAGGLALFPRSIRDAGYRFIARWRYRLFGPWHPQPLARAEWRARFLDLPAGAGAE